MEIPIPEDLKELYRIAGQGIGDYTLMYSSDARSNASAFSNTKGRELIERIAKAEQQNTHLKFALNRVWEVASGESQVAMDDTAGMEYLSDYVSSVWDEIHEGQKLASVPDPTSKLADLEQQLQAQREEIERLNSILAQSNESAKGTTWDAHMQAHGVEEYQQQEIAQLKQTISTLQATVTRLANEVEAGNAIITSLQGACERLGAPVSDEELRAHFFESDNGGFYLCNLESVDKLLASRATQE